MSSPGEPARVALVKSAGRADVFAVAIRKAGFVPVLVSPFRVEAVEGASESLAAGLGRRPEWVAVTSPHAAPSLEEHRERIAGLRIAAVGQGTASSLQSIGLRPLVIGEAGGAALAAAMVDAGLRTGDVVLHPCGQRVRPELGEALRSAGAVVRPVVVYRMVDDPVGERAADGEFAAVIVGSPRLAERAAGLFPDRPRAIAIGRTTAAALRDLGWPPVAVAARATAADVVGALAGLSR